MDQFVETISPIITNAVFAVLVLIIKSIAESAVKLAEKGLNELKERRIINENITIADLAAKSVKAVENIANVEKGQEKFDMAKERFSSLLDNAGIKLDPEQLETFIEAAVFEVNKAVKSTEHTGTILLEENDPTVQ